MIPAPLGKVYSLMWGPASGTFMKKWLVDDQKSRELSFEPEKGGLDDTHRTFTYSYIKPLNAPVGPRQTKCIVTATVENFDLEKGVSVNCSTATPDVPSGGVFTTKTRYCMMWGPNNSTRLIANCTVEWTGKSWLKGMYRSHYLQDITNISQDPLRKVRMMVKHSTSKTWSLRSLPAWLPKRPLEVLRVARVKENEGPMLVYQLKANVPLSHPRMYRRKRTGDCSSLCVDCWSPSSAYSSHCFLHRSLSRY
jgi:hypothetical protein